MTPRTVGWCALLALVAACANTELIEEVDRNTYESCTHPEWPVAQAAIEGGDVATASAALRAVVEACPEFAPAHAEWVRIAIEAGGEAEREMRSYYGALTDPGKSPVLPWVRARLERADSRKVDLLDASVERDPSFYFAYLDLAAVWDRSDRKSRQLEYLEKAIAAKPDSPEANLELARSLVSLGRGEEAVGFLETYLRARPDDVEAVGRLVHLLIYDLERVSDAVPWIERRQTAAPDDPAVLMDAAAAEWLRGERERAAVLYRRVLERDPADARAVLNLGNLWFQRPDRTDPQRREDWRKARNAYLYLIALGTYADVHDLRDLLVSVPFRLEAIDALLGPIEAGAPPPRLGSF